MPIRLAVNEKMKNYALTASDIRENRHLNSRIPPVPLENFQNESFLLLKSGNDTRTRADRICHNAHVIPKIKLELDQQITAYNLSRYGMEWGSLSVLIPWCAMFLTMKAWYTTSWIIKMLSGK